jgi:hypothetical protein
VRVVEFVLGASLIVSLIAPCGAEEAAKKADKAGAASPTMPAEAQAVDGKAGAERVGKVILPHEGVPIDPKLAETLDAFCTKWMGFLATRERDNRKSIHWQTGPDGVRGQFVGYSPDYQCQMKPMQSKKDTPVATIVYREYVYQQEGPSTSEAAEAAPRVMEATEVTEIFRYNKGKWVY